MRRALRLEKPCNVIGRSLWVDADYPGSARP
jgi:hypothetical protein